MTALFDRVVDLDPAARDAELAAEAASDPDVVAQVRALLDAHTRAGAFLDRPAWADDPDLLRTPDPLKPGVRLGPYRILRVIGHGGMGVVYAAEDTRLARTVALKALPPHVSRDPVARERLAREARAAASLAHPSIATVYALEDIEGDVFVASELVEGDTLRAELAGGGPFPHDRLIDTLTQIADALAFAHRHGIVHRDLKPENILRAPDGRIKIVDFGLAREISPRASGLTRRGTALGTPGYMAPEQLRGEAVDARADVFAFGVIAYELATARHPFGGTDPAAVVERLLEDEAPLTRSLEPPALHAIVRLCLRSNPEERYASAVDLAAALRQIPDPASRAVPAVPLARAAWWWQFHQVMVAIITIVAVAIVGVRRAWLDPWGSPLFVAALVTGTVSVTLRIHLWFLSLVHPATLGDVRARSLRTITIAEVALAGALGAAAGVLVGPHDGAAAWLTVTALILLLSLLVIEPATTRASLEDGRGHLNR